MSIEESSNLRHELMALVLTLAFSMRDIKSKTPSPWLLSTFYLVVDGLFLQMDEQ